MTTRMGELACPVTVGLIIAFVSLVVRMLQSARPHSERQMPRVEGEVNPFSIFEALGDRLQQEEIATKFRKCHRVGCGQVNPIDGCYCRRCGERLEEIKSRES